MAVEKGSSIFVQSSIVDPSDPPFFRALLEEVMCIFSKEGIDTEEEYLSCAMDIDTLVTVTRKVYRHKRTRRELPPANMESYCSRNKINLESLFKIKNEEEGNNHLLSLINDCTLNKIPFHLDKGKVYSLPCMRDPNEPEWTWEDYLSENKSKKKYDISLERFLNQINEHALHDDCLWRVEFFAKYEKKTRNKSSLFIIAYVFFLVQVGQDVQQGAAPLGEGDPQELGQGLCHLILQAQQEVSGHGSYDFATDISTYLQ